MTFLGSGTTVIAAEMTGRVCLGIELTPAYVDMAIARWERFTSCRAALLSGAGAVHHGGGPWPAPAPTGGMAAGRS